MCVTNFMKIWVFLIKSHEIVIWGCFLPDIVKTHNKGIYSIPTTPNWFQLHFKPLSVLIRAFADMLDSFEIGKFFFALDKLFLYYEPGNIIKKRINNLLFEHFS